MAVVKYKLSDLAKDLDRNSKEISALLTKYKKSNKNSSQTLTDEDLNA